jgi:hypothetical protein
MDSKSPARILQAMLLAMILGLHFYTRVCANLMMPPEEKHFWPSSYLVSLSLLSGNGFSYLLPSDVKADASVLTLVTRLRNETGPVGPVMDFLSGRGRESLSPLEFSRFLSNGTRPVPIDIVGPGLIGSRWETTRILDIYVAAMVWKLFGISWPVLFVFYALVSTAAALLVFLIAQRLTGSYWGGLVAAFGFLASPLERHAGAWSIRDTNPLWFTALAFFLLLRYAEPSSSRLKTYLGWYLVGAGSLLGLGWRSDAQMLLPFILIGLIGVLVAKGIPVSRLALAGALCLAGSLSVKSLIDWLGHGSFKQGGDVVFHIAWYGEHVRSDILGTENAFQVKQDDFLTLYQANYFREQRLQDSQPCRDYYDPRHLSSVRAMYLELARYNAYRWWVRFPVFLGHAAHVDRAVVPGPDILGTGTGGAWLALDRCLASLPTACRWCLDRYVSCIPYFFTLGVVMGLLRQESRAATLLLGGYFVYYAAALFLVLPESKHWAPLLLPLHVLSASGLWFSLTVFSSWRRVLLARDTWKHWLLKPLFATGSLALCWVLIALLAYGISRAQRRRFIDSVLSLIASGQGVPESLQTKRLFSVTASGEAPNGPIGYVLKVRCAHRAVTLFCVHVRKGTPSGSTPLFYYTRHRLGPDRDQFFFVNVVSGTRIGDDRPYTLYVGVRGRAELLAVTKVDLSGWKVGLPLSFVFNEDDDQPGSALIEDGLPVTDEFNSLPEAEAFVSPRQS